MYSNEKRKELPRVQMFRLRFTPLNMTDYMTE